MESCIEDEDDEFFDSYEDCMSNLSPSNCSVDFMSPTSNFPHQVCIKKLNSVCDSRDKLLRYMGISPYHHKFSDKLEIENAQTREAKGAVFRTNSYPERDDISSADTISSFRSTKLSELIETETDLSRSVSLGEFETRGPPFEVDRFMHRNEDGRKLSDTKKKLKKSWLRRLGVAACMSHGYVNLNSDTSRINIKVYPHRKSSKELTSLCTEQEFVAHGCSISTMKFSPDGLYLASAGEDGTVRVWKVTEDERSNKVNASEMDPSRFYFSINHVSELSRINVDREKLGKIKKSNDTTCVIFPPKIFHLSEKPLHEFRGHNGDVLDLSWSRKGQLLSSSVDKTVRLWQIGWDQCLGVFLHNNYVTCVEFNPVDDNYFMSGSIDGKVRIWQVLGCRVVNWTDIREMVTAVCYRPNGKGGIVGTITGNCRFYDISDNELQLDTQISIHGKKRIPSRRITGFQFRPNDPTIVLVASADSHVRILCGVDVVCKFKGIRSTGGQISASFTADGKHIISAGEHSDVYVWNYTRHENKTSFLSRAKNVTPSESFSSRNVSFAVPWCGMKYTPMPTLSLPRSNAQEREPRQDVQQKRPFCPLILSPKGTPTWPEETLLDGRFRQIGLFPPTTPRMCKFFKSTLTSPNMWGLVIVTAGWDGRIRTFLNYGLPVNL